MAPINFILSKRHGASAVPERRRRSSGCSVDATRLNTAACGSLCCTVIMAKLDEIWKVGQSGDVAGTGGQIYRQEFFETIEESINAINNDLRELSLDISGEVARIGLSYILLIKRSPSSSRA